MKHSLLIILMLLGLSAPSWSLAAQGDAMPGMAAHGIVRLPHEGMVDQTFRSRSRLGMRRYRQPSINSSRIDTQSKSDSNAMMKNFQDLEGHEDGASRLVRPHTNLSQ